MGLFNRDNSKKFRILSIDGGGMKGVFTARALKGLEEEFGIKIIEHFDMVVGTSTGALIAMSLLNGMSGPEIYEQYVSEENPTFRKSKSFREQWSSTFFAGFHALPLEIELLKEFPNDMKLSDIYEKSNRKTFAVFSTNFTKGRPIIYTSPDLVDDGSKLVKNDSTVFEALRTSTAAPLFFEPFVDKVTGDLLLDGGLWANNPSLAGINLALSQDEKLKPSDIEILSFGQTFIEDIEFKLLKGSELLKNPRKNQMTQLFTSALITNQNAQTKQVNYLLKSRHFRYSPEIEQKGLSISKVNINFLNYSKVYWSKNKESLVKFIKTGENTRK